MKYLAIAAASCLLGPAGAHAQSDPAPAGSAAPARMLVELYRIAPGQHEAFMRFIAMFDEANRRAGLPPRQLYVHQDGPGFDFMLIQPAETPPEKQAALDAAYKALKTPSGPDFFVSIRRFVIEHSDSFMAGPTTAANWLAELDAARAKRAQ